MEMNQSLFHKVMRKQTQQQKQTDKVIVSKQEIRNG